MGRNDQNPELETFHRFLAAQLDAGRGDLSPEDCVRAWRLQHPTPEDLKASVAAIRCALEQVQSGAAKPLDDFDRDFRARHGISDGT